MPTLDPAIGSASSPEPLTRLPFKPVTREHILHCSYDYWHAKYRSSTIKSRIIPLSPAFLSYLREDGIVLPSDTPTFPPPSSYNDNSTSTGWDEDEDSDPSLAFPEIHKAIKDAIQELGGLVTPKLNWSSPKDATWISIKKNSMECATANDIYLLLKSSSFITHDLEHAFDDCAPSTSPSTLPSEISYVLVLRKYFKLNPSCEFRCFVRQRTLVGISQRDLNHFPFLFPLTPQLRSTIQTYFNKTLKSTFPDEDFTFDIYLPPPHNQPRLIDINPWAPRTDPLLFSWLELLTLPLPVPLLGIPDSNSNLPTRASDSECSLSPDSKTETEDEKSPSFVPELRLVRKNDPEARNFATPQYSAHKLPKEVVDASLAGETGMKEFAEQWKRMMDGDVELQQRGESSDDEEDPSEEVVHESDILIEPKSAEDAVSGI